MPITSGVINCQSFIGPVVRGDSSPVLLTIIPIGQDLTYCCLSLSTQNAEARRHGSADTSIILGKRCAVHTVFIPQGHKKRQRRYRDRDEDEDEDEKEGYGSNVIFVMIMMGAL